MIVSRGNNLERARVLRGETITALAKAAGVNHSMICRAECGLGVRPETALKLCAALECEFDDLFEIKRKGVKA